MLIISEGISLLLSQPALLSLHARVCHMVKSGTLGKHWQLLTPRGPGGRNACRDGGRGQTESHNEVLTDASDLNSHKKQLHVDLSQTTSPPYQGGTVSFP